MNHHQQESPVSKFFQSYQSYWDRNFAISDPTQQWMAAPEALGAFESTKLRPPEWNLQRITEIETILDTTIPTDFVTFLCQHSFLKLECPLVSFAPTTQSGFLSLAQRFEGSRKIPIGYSQDSAGCYLIDPQNKHVIVHQSFGEREAWDDHPLCVSFSTLTAILAEFLDGKIKWYGPADPQRLKVIERAKSHDPSYFGGNAWGYWCPRLVEMSEDEVR